MIKYLISNNRIRVFIACFALALSVQQKAYGDPYVSGASSCWSNGTIVQMWAASWIEAGWYPEVQVIGHINTITQQYAPYVQVFGPYISLNTSVGTILYSPIYQAFALPGIYTIETLHGYIDDDETEHESGVTGWACYL